MRLELGEGAGALTPAIPQYLRNGQLGIVVEDALGHSAQERERRDVPVQEGLGGLGRVGLDEAAVAVGQVDDEAVGLLLHAADDHQGLAEVALGVSRHMGQRHEHLPGLTAILSDVVLDRGVSAISITTTVQGGMSGDARRAARRLAWERLARSLLSCVSSSHRSNSVGPNRSRGSISRTTR